MIAAKAILQFRHAFQSLELASDSGPKPTSRMSDAAISTRTIPFSPGATD